MLLYVIRIGVTILETYLNFIINNYIIIILILLIILLSVIGYMADKKGFMKKKKSNKNIKQDLVMSIHNNNELTNEVEEQNLEELSEEENMPESTNENVSEELTNEVEEQNLEELNEEENTLELTNENISEEITNEINNDISFETNKYLEETENLIEQLKDFKLPNMENLENINKEIDENLDDDIWKF